MPIRLRVGCWLVSASASSQPVRRMTDPAVDIWAEAFRAVWDAELGEGNGHTAGEWDAITAAAESYDPPDAMAEEVWARNWDESYLREVS